MSIERTVENVYLRQDAVTLTRKHFWRLLGMMLVIFIFTWLYDTALTTQGDRITQAETQAVLDAVASYAASERMTSSEPVITALINLFVSPGFLLFNLLYIVITGIVTNGLTLGRHAQILAVAAWDEKPKVLGSFCRMRYCFKAWRLAIWVAVKVLLWALPGLGCLLIGAELQTYGQLALGDIMIFAGVGLLLALTIRAGLSYCLSTFVLADEPYRGVRDCVNQSKEMMQYRRWQAFKLGVPMILKMLGSMYAAIMGLGILFGFIGHEDSLAVQIIVAILITLLAGGPAVYFILQFDMVYALFYLKRRIPADKSTSYWLQDHSAPASPALPEETPAASPEDIEPENTEEKEKTNEEPVC